MVPAEGSGQTPITQRVGRISIMKNEQIQLKGITWYYHGRDRGGAPLRINGRGEVRGSRGAGMGARGARPCSLHHFFHTPPFPYSARPWGGEQQLERAQAQYVNGYGGKWRACPVTGSTPCAGVDTYPYIDLCVLCL